MRREEEKIMKYVDRCVGAKQACDIIETMSHTGTEKMWEFVENAYNYQKWNVIEFKYG